MLMVAPIVVVSIQGLSRSPSTEDFIAGIFASVIMLAACVAIMCILWKGARLLRSKGI
jgi:ABC-type uncharacterized transport system permease subunit